MGSRIEKASLSNAGMGALHPASMVRPMGFQLLALPAAQPGRTPESEHNPGRGSCFRNRTTPSRLCPLFCLAWTDAPPTYIYIRQLLVSTMQAHSRIPLGTELTAEDLILTSV